MNRQEIRRTPMRPVRVEWICGVNECRGAMETTHRGVETWATRWEHRCALCGRVATNTTRYPHYEYESTGESPRTDFTGDESAWNVDTRTEDIS